MHELSSEFRDALAALDRLRVETIFQKATLLKPAIQVVEELIVPVMAQLGDEWCSGQVALSQIYMGSRICEELVERTLPWLAPGRKTRPRQAIAVLSDYHMLGKRIVLSTLRTSGLDVLDYGRMEVDELVERVRADDVKILLISTLMLPAALKVKTVRKKLDAAGSRIRIAVGGAPFLFDRQLWQEVGADAMGRNASEAVAIVRRWREEES